MSRNISNMDSLSSESWPNLVGIPQVDFSAYAREGAYGSRREIFD